jgi:probable addiction module antidote protein
MKPYRSYKEGLLKSLQNREEAFAYLQAALEDEDKRVFLLALRDVAEAQGGLSKLSRLAKLNREHLYDMLSHKGNPELAALKKLLSALGFKLSIELSKNSSHKKAA